MTTHFITREGRLLYKDEEFSRNSEQRINAAQSVVEALPASAPDVEKLLGTNPHRWSYEVQFTLLNCLDYSSISQQHIVKLLPAIEQFLLNVKTNSGYRASVCGCMLGGGWCKAAHGDIRRRILSILKYAVRNGKHVASREAALHGIEHALNAVSVPQGKDLLEVTREVYWNDRALSVKRSAYFILKRGDWWGSGAPRRPQLLRYAKRLGHTLNYPERNRYGNRKKHKRSSTARNR